VITQVSAELTPAILTKKAYEVTPPGATPTWIEKLLITSAVG
jgi:hypothetical protein